MFINGIIVCTFELIDCTMPISKQEIQRQCYYICRITAYETQKKSMLEQTSQFMITETVRVQVGSEKLLPNLAPRHHHYHDDCQLKLN